MFSSNCTEQKVVLASSLSTETKPNLWIKQQHFLSPLSSCTETRVPENQAASKLLWSLNLSWSLNYVSPKPHFNKENGNFEGGKRNNISHYTRTTSLHTVKNTNLTLVTSGRDQVIHYHMLLPKPPSVARWVKSLGRRQASILAASPWKNKVLSDNLVLHVRNSNLKHTQLFVFNLRTRFIK